MTSRGAKVPAGSNGNMRRMGEDADSPRQSGGKRVGVVVRSRKSIHLLRKVFHALAGILMAGAYEYIFTTQKEAAFFSRASLPLSQAARFCDFISWIRRSRSWSSE